MTVNGHPLESALAVMVHAGLVFPARLQVQAGASTGGSVKLARLALAGRCEGASGVRANPATARESLLPPGEEGGR